MIERRVLPLLCLPFLLVACEPPDPDDAGVPVEDTGPGGDAGASTDGGAGMDAGDMDASVRADAGSDLDGGDDAGVDGQACIELDAGEGGMPDAGEAGVPDGSLPPCPGTPRLPSCPGSTPALDFEFTMISTTPSGSASTDVRGRHYLDSAELLVEQRTREAMSAPAADLLRIWRASMSSSQLIYTIDPPTPHPFTLEPKARRDEAGGAGFFNGLATFPSYAMELLACLDAADTVACLDDRGRFMDTGTDEMVDGERCRVVMWSDESVTLCVPASCEARRTLYPYWVRGPSGISVDFEDPRPATHADVVVVEPNACETPVPMLTLCDHPDL